MYLYYLLLVIYFIFFGILAVKDLKLAVYILLFALPSYLIRFNVLRIPMTLLEGMIVFVFFIWLIKMSKSKNIKKLKQELEKIGKQERSSNYLILFIFIFLAVASLAMFIGPDLRAAAGVWKAYFIEPILFLIVFISLIKKKDIKIIFNILFFQAILLSLVAIYQKNTGDFIPNDFWAAAATRRVTSVFEYPNALALYLAPILILLVGYLFTQITNYKLQIINVLFKVFISLAIMAGLLAIYFTKSKGALLGILAGILFYILFYKGARRYFIGILLVMVLLTAYAVQFGKIDLKGSSTVAGGDSVTTRLEMWQETWQMIKDRPLAGAGLAGHQQAMRPYHQKEYIEVYLYPHNIFLNFWSELGLLGLLSFLSIVIWFYWVGFKNMGENYSIISMAAMTVILIHGLVDVPYFKNDLSILFWLLMGMMIFLGKEKTGEISVDRV